APLVGKGGGDGVGLIPDQLDVQHGGRPWLGGFGGCRRLGFDAGDRADAVVGVEVDDPRAHGVTALGRDFVGVDADDLALRGHQQDVVTVPHLQHADHGAVAAGGLDVDDALAGPALQPVLLERRALAEATLGHREDLGAFLHDVRADDGVALLHVDAANAAGAAAHRTHLVLGEADGHARLRGDHHLALAVRAMHRHELVALVQPDGQDAAGARARLLPQPGLLHLALACAEPR